MISLAVILGGGAGSRLYPLTKARAKPAVSIGGAYRLVDIPISNCINSGVNKIYILTQYNSTSLNRHVSRTYNRGVTFAGKRNAGIMEDVGFVRGCVCEDLWRSWQQHCLRPTRKHGFKERPTLSVVTVGFWTMSVTARFNTLSSCLAITCTVSGSQAREVIGV